MNPTEITALPPVDELTGRSPRDMRRYEPETIPAADWHANQADEDRFISPRLLLRVFWQWWYIALPVAALLAMASAGLVMMNFRPVYRATAVLTIASSTPYIAYASNDQLVDHEEFIETQVELLRSPLVMERLLESSEEIRSLPEIQSEESPAGWLSGQVRVDQVGNSELYYVHFDGPNPENAKLLVDGILHEYFAIRELDAQKKTQRVLELLEDETKVRATEIARLRDEMRELGKDVAGTNPLTGMPEADGKLKGPLAEIGEQWSKAEVDRKMLEMRIIALRETLAKNTGLVSDSQVEIALSESQEINELRSLIATKKAMLHRIESVVAGGSEASAYKRLEREIASYERSLSNAVAKSRPAIKQQLDSFAELESKDLLDQLQAELTNKKVLEELLRDRYDELLADAGASGNKMLELEFLRSELEREENVFGMIAERSMALTTETRAPGRVSLLQPAELPSGPVRTIPLKNLVAVILASGCLPFGLALIWELSVRRIADVDQLSQQAALPIVGEVAKLPMRLRSFAPGGTRAMNLFEESIDSLRVGLVLPDHHRDVKVIAVTSAVHGEGKSSISSQLAVSLGRATPERVLLIDGDLRAPDVHNIFDLPNNVGLTAVLEGKAELEEAIITNWSDNVHLLPAGRLRKSPHKLMSISALQELLDELRPQYRYIVIDTPPILSASEALMLTKVADGTVLSTRRNLSRESQVRIAYQRLVRAGARPMGAVFNGVPTRSYMQTYGSYDYARSFG